MKMRGKIVHKTKLTTLVFKDAFPPKNHHDGGKAV